MISTNESYAPQVAVCIPNYNYGSFIGRCIESVLNQTYKSFQIIISDNASTDESDRMIKKYAGDKRIHYIRQSKPISMVDNWRACIRAGSAPYAILLSSDDYLKSTMIERCMSALIMDKEIALCHTAVECVNDNGKVITTTGAFTPSYVKEGCSLIKQFILGKRMCNSSVVFKRSCFDEIGGWSDDYKICVDLDLWFRMLIRWKVAYIGGSTKY